MYRTKRITTKAVLDIETGELLHWEGYLYSGPLDLCEGENSDGAPATPDAGAGDGNEGGQGGDEQYFLEVDDRTRYRTAEEAQEGYRQAAERITELTPWQQTAAEYGLTSPDDLAALADELAELRAQRQSGGEPARGTQGAGQGTNQPAAGAAPAANLDPNSPEGKEAAAIAWLNTHGVKAGLVTSAQLDALNERLDSLNAQAEQVEQERFEQRMDAGRNVLTNELKEAGLYPSDPKDTAGIKAAQELSSFLEDALTTWVNADQRRVNAFHAGGESLQTLIKAGLQRILPTLNVLRSSSGAKYAAGKERTANSGQRTLPAGSRTPAAPAKKPTTTAGLKPEDGITPSVHEAAWAVFQKTRGDQA